MSSSSNTTELKNLKEAIIDLYLAIKIRSTEEVNTFRFKYAIIIFSYLSITN